MSDHIATIGPDFLLPDDILLYLAQWLLKEIELEICRVFIPSYIFYKQALRI